MARHGGARTNREWTAASRRQTQGSSVRIWVRDDISRRLRCTWDGGRSFYGGDYPGRLDARSCNPGAWTFAIRDLSRAVAVGPGGQIHRMVSGTWVSANEGSLATLTDVAMSGTTLVAVGQDVVHSSDRGATWRELPVPAQGSGGPPQALTAAIPGGQAGCILFDGPSFGVAVGGYGFIATLERPVTPP